MNTTVLLISYINCFSSSPLFNKQITSLNRCSFMCHFSSVVHGLTSVTKSRFEKCLSSPILLTSSTVTIRSTYLNKNVFINDTLFQSCTTSESGGAIYAEGFGYYLNVGSCTFRECTALNTDTGGGGICSKEINITMNCCAFIGCKAYSAYSWLISVTKKGTETILYHVMETQSSGHETWGVGSTINGETIDVKHLNSSLYHSPNYQWSSFQFFISLNPVISFSQMSYLTGNRMIMCQQNAIALFQYINFISNQFSTFVVSSTGTKCYFQNCCFISNTFSNLCGSKILWFESSFFDTSSINTAQCYVDSGCSFNSNFQNPMSPMNCDALIPWTIRIRTSSYLLVFLSQSFVIV